MCQIRKKNKRGLKPCTFNSHEIPLQSTYKQLNIHGKYLINYFTNTNGKVRCKQLWKIVTRKILQQIRKIFIFLYLLEKHYLVIVHKQILSKISNNQVDKYKKKKRTNN